MTASVPEPPQAVDSPVRALSWTAFLTIYLPAVVLSLGFGIATPAIPILAKSFDVSFGTASYVITAFLIGGMVGTLPTGWLIDRLGRRPLLVAGPLLTAVVAFLVMVAQSFPELLIYRFFDGWAAQMWVLARLAGISQSAGAGERGRQVNWMFGMDTVGRLAGPIVGGVIATLFGPRAPFAAYGVLALIALVPTVQARDPRGAEQARQRRGDGRSIAWAKLVLPRLAFFGIAFFSALARGPIFADMLHLYAAFAYNLNAAGIGVLAALGSGVALPLTFVAGWLLDRFGRKVTMVPGFLGVAITMLMLAGTAYLHASLMWYVVVFLLAVTTQGLTSGSVQTVGTDVAPPEARGMFLGLWRFTGQVGTSISPIVFAFLADRTGYGSSFIFVSIAALVTAVLLITLIPETSRAKSPASVA